MPATLEQPAALEPPTAGYARFLASKAQLESDGGFEPSWIPDILFPFQRALAEWACRKGRGAVLASCGLGKTAVQLVWAENVVRRENRPVIIATPLSVSHQTVSEGAKFGVECRRQAGGRVEKAGIVVTNYERLHHFEPSDFAGMVCDESSILKNFDGERRKQVTEFSRRMPYRLLCTATPAPNDYPELGTSSEALGGLGYQDMLTRFFKKENQKDHLGWGRQLYRMRGHAEREFWRWVCSWARACRRPSDLGFDDGPFVLPPLEVRQSVVKSKTAPPGYLPGFVPAAVTMPEQRQERRRTLDERCERAAGLLADADSGIAWCHLNDEGDLLTKLIPGAVQVSGADEDEEKEEAFTAFTSGQARVLVSKPRVAGFGLNFQHCCRQTCFPSHSYEEWHQAVRRCWRFGQKRPVAVDVVTTEGEAAVTANLSRKTEAAERMFDRLVGLMNESMGIERSDPFTQPAEGPPWL